MTLQQPSSRFLSLDVFRGLVMVLLMTEATLDLPRLAAFYPDSALWQFVGYQTSHERWVGCRLWDMNTGEKLDKDRFRRDLGGEDEAYQEVARRLGLLDTDNGPSEVLDLSAHRKLRGK